MNRMASARSSTIRAAIEHAKEACQISGFVVTVAFGQGSVETISDGMDAKGNPLAPDSLFPVASLTKLAVALAILRLWDQGRLSVDDPLVRFIPEAAAAQPGVTLKRLLTHSAGLSDLSQDAWVYDATASWRSLAQAYLKIAPDTPPGRQVAYSGVNYGLLAIVVEHVMGQSFQEAITELVIHPLGMEAYLGVEPPRLPAWIIDPPDSHVGTPLEKWNTPFWRSLGGPDDGLVTTPSGALSLIRAYQGLPEGFLHPETIQVATQDQTGGLGGGFAWQQWLHCPMGLGPFIIAEQMNHFLLPTAPAGLLCLGGYSGCGVFGDPATDVAWSIHGTRTAADGWTSQAFPIISAAVTTSGF